MLSLQQVFTSIARDSFGTQCSGAPFFTPKTGRPIRFQSAQSPTYPGCVPFLQALPPFFSCQTTASGPPTAEQSFYPRSSFVLYFASRSSNSKSVVLIILVKYLSAGTHNVSRFFAPPHESSLPSRLTGAQLGLHLKWVERTMFTDHAGIDLNQTRPSAPSKSVPQRSDATEKVYLHCVCS